MVVHKNRKYKLFMLVSNDKYELPRSLPMNIHEMAKLTGLKESSIYWACTPSAERRWRSANTNYRKHTYRIVSWYDDGNDDDDYSDLVVTDPKIAEKLDQMIRRNRHGCKKD